MDVTPHDPFETTISYDHFGYKDFQFKPGYSSHPPGTAQPIRFNYKEYIILGAVAVFLWFQRS